MAGTTTPTTSLFGRSTQQRTPPWSGWDRVQGSGGDHGGGPPWDEARDFHFSTAPVLTMNGLTVSMPWAVTRAQQSCWMGNTTAKLEFFIGGRINDVILDRTRCGSRRAQGRVSLARPRSSVRGVQSDLSARRDAHRAAHYQHGSVISFRCVLPTTRSCYSGSSMPRPDLDYQHAVSPASLDIVLNKAGTTCTWATPAASSQRDPLIMNVRAFFLHDLSTRDSVSPIGSVLMI
jgi:hypothetical protein